MSPLYNPPTAGGGAPVLRTEPQRLWAPTGTIAENFSRVLGLANATGVASGTLRLSGGMVLPSGVPINNITMSSATTAAGTPTNQWFCLVRASDLAVLAKTVDDTTAAWVGSTVKTLALSATYTPTEDTPVYVGLLVAATTPPSMAGQNSLRGPNDLVPVLIGNSTTGLTNPASLGATAAAITTASNQGSPWAAVS